MITAMNFTIYIDEDGSFTITDLTEDFIPLVLKFTKKNPKNIKKKGSIRRRAVVLIDIIHQHSKNLSPFGNYFFLVLVVGVVFGRLLD